MVNVIYWLDVEGDRTGLVLVVNGLPAERLMRTHGLRMPINEYLHSGANLIELRRGLWASNKDDAEGGKVRLKLIRATFQTSLKLGEEVVAEQEGVFTAAPAGAALAAISFAAASAPAPPPLTIFDPIGPAQRAMILDRLGEVAKMWRRGDDAGLKRWMGPYLDDYVRAYPLESRKDMEQQISRMAQAFADGTVEFDRDRTMLDPIAGSNLVDCLGPRGAAVRIARSNGPDYDMWSVVGVRGDEVILVR